MKITRRLHMYFGLILTPFVLLYGVTAILFNHPTLLSDRSRERVQPELLAAVEFPSAEQLADRIVASINAESNEPFVRVDGSTAFFRNDYILDANTDETLARYRINAPKLTGSVTRTPVDETDSDEGDSPTLPDSIDAPLEAEATAIIDALRAETGSDRVRVRRAPGVEFLLESGGTRWAVTCNLNTGALDARRVGAPTREIDLRSFLTRLHVSRGYPDEIAARWVWAVLVDVTAGLMIFWAVSGVVMWWQLRPTRKSGALAAAAGILGAAILGLAMFQVFYY